jgi:hypothetical protein
MERKNKGPKMITKKPDLSLVFYSLCMPFGPLVNKIPVSLINHFVF